MIVIDLVPIIEKIEKSWSFETSYCNDRFTWQCADPSYYQCKTTAKLLKTIAGGLIMKGIIEQREHHWNFINGLYIDLTRRQFRPGAVTTDRQQATDDELIKNDWEQERYNNLVNAFNTHEAL